MDKPGLCVGGVGGGCSLVVNGAECTSDGFGMVFRIRCQVCHGSRVGHGKVRQEGVKPSSHGLGYSTGAVGFGSERDMEILAKNLSSIYFLLGFSLGSVSTAAVTTIFVLNLSG